jgi:hypothetical protein
VETPWTSMKGRIRNHVFRAWTAAVPEMLTWWKRTTTTIIEAVCNLLPYPWGDRIEATLGDFGLWVQITVAIIAFRILMWLAISLLRRMWTVHDRRSGRSLPP